MKSWDNLPVESMENEIDFMTSPFWFDGINGLKMRCGCPCVFLNKTHTDTNWGLSVWRVLTWIKTKLDWSCWALELFSSSKSDGTIILHTLGAETKPVSKHEKTTSKNIGNRILCIFTLELAPHDFLVLWIMMPQTWMIASVRMIMPQINPTSPKRIVNKRNFWKFSFSGE